jgi:hypothetical protein
MSSKKSLFPPKKIVDLDRRSAGNFLALLRDSLVSPITLVIGAGVSASAGLPTWNTLIRRICATFFEHWGFDIARGKRSVTLPPRELSIVFFDEDFWSEEAVKASENLAKQDALLVAQQIKNCIRDIGWRYLIRKVAYNYDVIGNHGVKKSRLVQSLANLCSDLPKFNAIISYNWDNVLELELKALEMKVAPLWQDKQIFPKGSLPIYYPHGYIPLEGGPVSDIILAESDYQIEAIEPYYWANLIQTQAFGISTCVFIGTSMTDPNLRRLLHISANTSPFSKYAFLPCQHQNKPVEMMLETLFDKDLARLGVKTIRYPVYETVDESHSRLSDLIDLFQQHFADKYVIWSK